jgi:hypothetical protein
MVFPAPTIAHPLTAEIPAPFRASREFLMVTPDGQLAHPFPSRIPARWLSVMLAWSTVMLVEVPLARSAPYCMLLEPLPP